MDETDNVAETRNGLDGPPAEHHDGAQARFEDEVKRRAERQAALEELRYVFDVAFDSALIGGSDFALEVAADDVRMPIAESAEDVIEDAIAESAKDAIEDAID